MTMRIHPLPLPSPTPLRRRIIPSEYSRQKKLTRLPHIFEKVLELPFGSDAEVRVEESLSCFRFVVGTDDIVGRVWAHTIHIHPGVTKVVVRGSNIVTNELEMDTWRFRLPEWTMPEMATAEYGEGELVVTVPKGEEDGEGGGFGAGRLVLVQ